MKNNTKILIPIIIAVSLVAGILIGNQFTHREVLSNHDRKINTILNLISQGYVDTVNIPEIVEQTIPQMLTNLDPHTVYIPAKDLTAVNNELQGWNR